MNAFCHTGMQVYDNVDSIRWSRPEGRLYVLAKRGSRDLRKFLWLAQPPPTNTFIETSPPHPRPAKRRCPSKKKDADLQSYRSFILYEDLNTQVSVLEDMFGLSPTI